MNFRLIVAATNLANTINNSAPMDALSVEEFVAGMLYGFVQKDDLAELEKCITNLPILEQEVEEAIADFEKGDLSDILKGVEVAGKIIQQLPEDLKDCENIQDDLKRLEAYAQIFTDPTKLAETVFKNFVAHDKAVLADIEDLTEEVKDGSPKAYYQAGDDVADVVVQLLGPVPQMNTLY